MKYFTVTLLDNDTEIVESEEQELAQKKIKKENIYRKKNIKNLAQMFIKDDKPFKMESMYFLIYVI